MNDSDFEIGDRVRLFGHPYVGAIETGEIVDCAALYRRGEWEVEIDGYGGSLSFYENEMERLPANEFKAGDRVRLIEDNDGYGVKGDTGVILRAPNYVRFDREIQGDTDWYVDRACMELAPAFAVGDKVKIVSGPDNGGFGEIGDTGTVDVVYNEMVRLCFDSGAYAGESWWVESKHLAPVATLSIEAGKYYKTRDGRKVGPIAQNGSMPHLFGAPQPDISGNAQWYDNGRALSSGEHPSDLVAEWVDEPAAATPKFKVGDRVRNTRVPEAGIGIIEVVKPEGGYTVNYKDTWYARCHDADDMLEPANDTTLGDILAAAVARQAIVCRIENGQPRPATRPYVHPDGEAAIAEADRLARTNPGKEFGVYELVATRKEAKVYEHEWQRLAAGGQKIAAIKEVRDANGFTLKGAKDAVEHWLAVEAA